MNQKDLKRFKKILEESKRSLLSAARKTLTEEAAFDTDDLPDEIDLASSEYTQSMVFRLRDREKFLLKKIDDALEQRFREVKYARDPACPAHRMTELADEYNDISCAVRASA